MQHNFLHSNVSRVKQLSQRESVRDLKGPRSPSFYRDVGSVLKDGQSQHENYKKFK